MGYLSVIYAFHILTTLSIYNSSVMQPSVGKGGRRFNHLTIDVCDRKHSAVAVDRNNLLLGISSNFHITTSRFPDDSDIRRNTTERVWGVRGISGGGLGALTTP